MPFWSSPTLRNRIPDRQLVVPYDETRVVHSAYELGVGSEAFVTSNPSGATQLPAGAKIVIPPGQFGLLVTKERVCIPNNVIAFISIRAGIKFQGLVNVSGFHVDPGFSGNLKFAVYNAGSQTIVLDQNQRVFMIWFADLDQNDDAPYSKQLPDSPIVTANDVMRIQGEVASPAVLKQQIDELRRDLESKVQIIEQIRLQSRFVIALIISLLALAVASYRAFISVK